MTSSSNHYHTIPEKFIEEPFFKTLALLIVYSEFFSFHLKSIFWCRFAVIFQYKLVFFSSFHALKDGISFEGVRKSWKIDLDSLHLTTMIRDVTDQPMTVLRIWGGRAWKIQEVNSFTWSFWKWTCVGLCESNYGWRSNMFGGKW